MVTVYTQDVVVGREGAVHLQRPTEVPLSADAIQVEDEDALATEDGDVLIKE